MSYFAKSNFIVYDEWFDEDLEKNKLDFKNKKIKKISKIHDFFYEQSNYKIGASENNLQLDIKENKKELITNNYHEKSSEKYTSVKQKNFSLTHKIPKSNLKFSITKKIIYSFSIFSFLLIFGFVIFFISSSKKSESNTFSVEKELKFTKKDY